MHNLSELSNFTVPLAPSVHQIAKQFSRHHPDAQKAKQVYLNTLAVCAVHFYLECMGIESDCNASQSWDSLSQILMDVADLILPELGQLECCPTLTGAQIVLIQEDVGSERIGFVVVEFEPALNTATLLGFTPTADNGRILVQQLRSLDDLMVHLQQLKEMKSVKSEVRLSQWLQGVFATGWQAVETLFASHQPLELSFRSDISVSETIIKRGKFLDLGLQLGQQSVVLLIAVTPAADQKFEITAQVHPAAGITHLPANLKLILLAETKDVLQEVTSRSQDDFIRLKRFRGLPGEPFKIQLTLNDVSIEESFVI
jgi:hypothetical protein